MMRNFILGSWSTLLLMFTIYSYYSDNINGMLLAVITVAVTAFALGLIAGEDSR